MVKLTDATGEWAIAVGRVMIAFGSIEHVTLVCLKKIPRDAIYRSTSKLNLAPRITLLLEILSVHQGDSFETLINLLNEALCLAKTRNLIAHNPLTLGIYEEEGNYSYRQEIIALHKDEVLTLDDVQRCAHRAELLAGDLYGVTASVFAALDVAL
jgi:hypothetical protein